MTERSRKIARFVASSPWGGWREERIAGDASSRVYTRLIGPEGSVIVMDADPKVDSGTAAFVTLARWLTDADLCAPRILATDLDLGLVVMTDLGRARIADILATEPSSEAPLYDAATDVLVKIDALSPPKLAAMTPAVAGQMVSVTAQHYAHCAPDDLCAAVENSMAGMTPDRLALRDVHAENLIWRPDHSGTDRIGLLDFQDAILAPRGYDLASLLSDIRRDVAPDTRALQIARFATATGMAEADLGRDLAILGAQRNLRILGVFARLIETGKSQYARHMHRVWTTLLRDLDHPALADLRAIVLRDLPPVSA